MDEHTTDVLVIGSGIAGLAAALGAIREGASVTIATKATKPEGASTWWAQGGVAIAHDDPESFKSDIRTASSDTADATAIEVLVENANDTVRDVLIETLNVDFDSYGGDETFDFAQEAAHSRERILHVDASTGKHVHIPFLNYLNDHDDVTLLEDTTALELIRHEGMVAGAMLESEGEVKPTYAGSTILATGGIGDLYPRTTNPHGSTGDGIAMAALAGAAVSDMEYVQFHPTVYSGEDPFLLSEAVRGEGALLRNGNGERFMSNIHDDAELAPRDIVARAVQCECEKTGEVILDVSPINFKEAFPDLARRCTDSEVNWSNGIPVAPAEHFLCGGISVDEYGRTTLNRLYAVGECACTGVHGANRLASTSLLEGLVWGLRAGGDASGAETAIIEASELLNRDPELPNDFVRDKFSHLQRVMDEYVGLQRDPSDLKRAQAILRRLKGEVDAYTRIRTSRSLYELRNASVTALLIARAAAENSESIGTHNIITNGGTEEERIHR